MLFKKRAKKSYLLKHRGTKCLNCGHPLDLSDRYCPKCSQINSTKRITFLDLIREFFDAVFSYDSKFRLTIVEIIRHPGKITQEYVSGKRMSYTNPFRFFLSILFITIILLNLAFDLQGLDEVVRKNFAKVEREIERFPKDTAKIRELNESKDKLKTYGLITEDFEIDSTGVKKSKNLDSIHYMKAPFYFDSINNTDDGTISRIISKGEIFSYGITKDTLLTYDHLLEKMKVQNNWENRIAYKYGYNQYKSKTTPSQYAAFLINNLPFVIFFSIPFLAMFIWLIYSKKKFFYMDHLVFCYQTLTMFIFSYLLIIIIYLLTHHALTIVLLVVIMFFYNTFYLYKAMRRFYQQSRVKTFLKYIFINTIFSILATVFITFFALISFILY